jgi:hypothetical protein
MTIDVSYTQLAVFDPALEKPFNDWRPEHVDQGFAWRPGSVSFGTLEESGPIDVQMRLASKPQALLAETQRAMQVPFTVPEAGVVVVASIGGAKEVDVPAGGYQLVFEHGIADDRMWARITLVREPSPRFAVLVADDELDPPDPLVTDAEPAT